MEQTVTRDGEFPVHTLRSPIRIGGARTFSPNAAPRVGQDNDHLRETYLDD